MRVAMQSLERKLSKSHPQLMLADTWSNFLMVATAAACAGLSLRLHFEIDDEGLRTPLEFMVRGSLDKEFSQGSDLFERCSIFLSDSLSEIPRGERSEYVFPFLGVWVVASLCGEKTPEDEDLIVGKIGMAIQNETVAYWSNSMSGS